MDIAETQKWVREMKMLGSIVFDDEIKLSILFLLPHELRS
jgi:hypothetical protein